MGKIAFVFSGQGAQYSGMGQALYDGDPAARAVFDRLEQQRPGTLQQCFSGSEAELQRTENTQPCIFALELAAAAALAAKGVRCDACAGFSLGEIAALTHSGAVNLDEGFRLVCLRGRLMQREAEKHDCRMAAVVKLPPETVEALCARYEQVYPVNYNCPGQIAVAGRADQMALLGPAVKEAGGRAIPLKVGGGFHCPFMAPAAEEFAQALTGAAIQHPAIPLYSDYTAQPYTGDYIGLLSKQICSPVRWQALVENMAQAGVDTFIEVGPGKTLCGLIGKTLPEAKLLHVEDPDSLAQTAKEAGIC